MKNNRWLTHLKKMFFVAVATLISGVTNAQTAEPQMADTMRSNGKIYVVVAVCLTILLGLFMYVIIVDRKISKLEKEA